MKLITLILTLFVSVSNAQLIKVGPWNAYLHNPNKAAPLIINFPGTGQVGFNANDLLTDGFGSILSKTTWRPPKEAFIVVIQDQYGAYPASYIKGFLNTLKGMYPLIDTANIYVTGFSIGGQAAYSSILGIVPKAIIAHSPAAIDANATAKIIAYKIPTYLYAGETDGPSYRPNAENAAAAINAKVPGLARLQIFPGVGHTGWNDTYKSAAFWDIIKGAPPVQVTVNAGTDQTIMLTDTLKLSGSATGAVKWKVMEGGVYQFVNKDSTSLNVGVTFMKANTYTLRLTASYGYDEMKVTVKAPPPPPPLKEAFKVHISGTDFIGMENGTVKRSKGTWSGSSGVLVAFPCGDKIITVTNKGLWTIK